MINYIRKYGFVYFLFGPKDEKINIAFENSD